MNRTRTRGGFSLIELIVVMVIIAIISTIAMVAYRGIQKKADLKSLTTTAQSVDHGASALFATGEYSNLSEAVIETLNAESEPILGNAVGLQPSWTGWDLADGSSAYSVLWMSNSTGFQFSRDDIAVCYTPNVGLPAADRIQEGNCTSANPVSQPGQKPSITTLFPDLVSYWFVSIGWTAVQSATSYQLFSVASDGSLQERLCSQSESNTCRLRWDYSPGETVRLKMGFIRTRDGVDHVVGYSNELQIDIPPIPAPQNVRVTDTTTSAITVSWNHVPSAEEYTVRLAGVEHTFVSPTDLADPTTRSYTLTNLQPGQTYDFEVRARVRSACAQWSTCPINSGAFSAPLSISLAAAPQQVLWAGYNGPPGPPMFGFNNPVPTQVNTSGVLADKTVTTISAGDNHTCAVADGKAYCWGLNSAGQLGDGTTTKRDDPVAVSASGVLAGKTVTAVSAGTSHTCAVADGKAYCWGNNASRQLGDSTTISRATPGSVSASGVLAGKTVTSVSAGTSHTCAVADGKAYCWGTNTSRQLGDSTTTNRSTPVAVSASGVLAGKTVTAVSAGTSHTCAVAGSKAYCWGNNYFGSLGDGTNTDRSTPVAVNASGVLAGKTVTSVDAGNSQSCALADGNAYCWGYNFAGQLGDGTTTNRNTPVAVNATGVLAGKTVTSVSVGYDFTCAVADGSAYCWGVNTFGQLGDGTTTNRNTPTSVQMSNAAPGSTTAFASAGGLIMVTVTA